MGTRLRTSFEKVLLFSRLRAIGHDYNQAAHTFKIHGNLSGKQENRNRIFDSVNDEWRLCVSVFLKRRKQRAEGHAKAAKGFPDIDKCHSKRSRGISIFFCSVTVEVITRDAWTLLDMIDLVVAYRVRGGKDWQSEKN